MLKHSIMARWWFHAQQRHASESGRGQNVSDQCFWTTIWSVTSRNDHEHMVNLIWNMQWKVCQINVT